MLIKFTQRTDPRLKILCRLTSPSPDRLSVTEANIFLLYGDSQGDASRARTITCKRFPQELTQVTPVEPVSEALWREFAISGLNGSHPRLNIWLSGRYVENMQTAFSL